MENSSVESGGLSALSLLLISFIVLKLCNVIDWSWWWVLSPLWMPFAIVGITVLILFLIRYK